jgi:hypothetical protein
MMTLFIVWLAVGFYLQKERYSAGMPLAYFLGVTLIHVPGAVLYPDSEDMRAWAIWSQMGFAQTAIGMVAFSVGVAVARHIARRYSATFNSPGVSARQKDVAKVNRLAILYLWVGGSAYFVFLPILGRIPSVAALIGPLGSLLLVGACLRLWIAGQLKDRGKYWSTIALLPLLPVSTVVQAGFLNFGTCWALTIASFIYAQSKYRLGLLLLTPVVIYVGLSVFVDYMDVRTDIRKVVWSQNSFAERVAVVESRILSHFSWFDLANPKHRAALNARLNQNLWVGRSEQRLEEGQVSYAYGSTVQNMILGLIPRAIWPDKPVVGGGGDVVTHYTGFNLDRSTSWGAGQVLEFYVNFSTLGVIGGFLLWGWLLGTGDFLIIKYLDQGDQARVLFWFLICLSMMHPEGNLLEIFVGGIGAVVVAFGMNFTLYRHRSVEAVPSLPRA